MPCRGLPLASSPCSLDESRLPHLRQHQEATLQRLMRTAVLPPGGGGMVVLPTWPEALEVGGGEGGGGGGGGGAPPQCRAMWHLVSVASMVPLIPLLVLTGEATFKALPWAFGTSSG